LLKKLGGFDAAETVEKFAFLFGGKPGPFVPDGQDELFARGGG